MKHLRLTGAEVDLRVVLDRLHVHAIVVGVVEGDGQFEVAIEGALPALDSVVPDSVVPGSVVIEEREVDVAPVTGLENDRVIRVGANLVVRPPWVTAPADFTGIELVVPRAMAFGSGEHGSTQAALCMMERVYSGVVESVADIGTGSGILALYAQALGCERIFACDIDPDSVAAARELLPEANIVRGGPEAIVGPVDAVVANMRGSEIRSCIAALLALWNRRGPLVLSGLRPGEAAVFDADVGRHAQERVEVGGFVALGWRGEV